MGGVGGGEGVEEGVGWVEGVEEGGRIGNNFQDDNFGFTQTIYLKFLSDIAYYIIF